MKQIGLVAPLDHSMTGNPGWHMITAGIRWLVRQVHPEVSFLPINMVERDVSWDAVTACETVIVCGNPRFSLSPGDAFWEHGIWSQLQGLTAAGVQVLDGWAGSCFPFSEQPLTADEMAVALTFMPQRHDYLGVARGFHGRITRDATMQRIYERVAIPSILLPCSSWWARQEFATHLRTPQYDVLVLHESRQTGWFNDAMKAVIEARFSERPLQVVAVTWNDLQWAADNEIMADFIPDPASLLNLFAAAGNVLSFRLHAAIPAASMGCAVTAVAIDSRAYACNPFEIPVVRFTDLPKLPPFVPALPPATEYVVHELANML